MRVKHRNLFWPMILLIGVTTAALALVSARKNPLALPEPGRKDAAHQFADAKLPERLVKGSVVPKLAFPALSGNSETRPIEVEPITVRPGGFEPNEIIRPRGSFVLAMSNHSRLNELSLRLDRLNGERLHAVRLPRGRIGWSQVLELPPGDYVLSEENHPNWICQIKITSH